MRGSCKLVVTFFLATSCAFGAALAQEAAPPRPEITDPAVLAVLESSPTTPDELVRAVNTLVALKRADLAKPFFKALAAAELDDAAAATLVRKFGSDVILQMARQPALQPESLVFSQKILAAAERFHTDPDRLASLIQRLQDPSPRVRARTIVELKAGGAAAVHALLAVLADAGRQDEHAAVRSALIAQESNAIDPLTAALHGGSDLLKTHAAQVLGALRAETALKFLLRPAHDAKLSPQLQHAAAGAIQQIAGRPITRQEAIAYLRSEADEYIRGVLPAAPDAKGMVTIWDWDAENQQAVTRIVPAEDASWRYAFWLASDLFSLAPEDADARRLYLTTLFQSEAFRQGLDQPLDLTVLKEAAMVAGPRAVAEVLADALARKRAPAAMAACKLLGEIGSAELLYGKEISPVVAAAQHADRRLRVAALEAIMRWNPDKPYAGSAAVAQSLAFLASSRGRLRVVIGDRAAPIARLAGLLTELGYEPVAAGGGRDVLRHAIASPDVALVLVDSWLPGVDAALQQLRADHRTAAIPIGVLNNLDDPDAAQKLANRYPPATVIYRPTRAQDMEFQLGQLLQQAGRSFISLQERRQHAAAALGWLAQLSADDKGIYDLRCYDRQVEAGLYRSETVPAAAACLANLGTPFGQRTLVELASLHTAPVADRQAAAAAFAKGVQRYGVLLTTVEIQRQYDRYNASEKMSEETQQVLSSLLDAIESKRPRKEP